MTNVFHRNPQNEPPISVRLGAKYSYRFRLYL